MTDSSWDNQGLGRPAKKGWPLWAKLLMGCGLVVAIGVVACVGGIATCAGAVNRAADTEWAATRTVVQQLQTDEGAKAVYAANPGLAADFPSEEAFLERVRAWRPHLEPLPAQKPGITTGKVDLNIAISNGRRTVTLIYLNGKGARLSARWEDGRLTGLLVE